MKIVNPAATKATISYSLDGQSHSLPSGSAHTYNVPANAVVEFARGSEFGTAIYSVDPGTYTFASTPKGWELFHGDHLALPSLAVKIVNPPATKAAISYSLAGQSHSLPPGSAYVQSPGRRGSRIQPRQ